MTRKLLSVLLFTVALMNQVKSDDHDYNELEEGEELWLDPEVEAGQIDNLHDQPDITPELENETAEWDIAHEHNDVAHLHVTFRNKYLGVQPCEDGEKTCKKKARKLSKDHYNDLIAPQVEQTGVKKLDEDKPLIYMNKYHKTNISIECNFAAEDIIDLVKTLKNMKEVLLIEFRKLDDEGHH